VCHFETALYGHRDKWRRQGIRLSVLKELQDAPNVVFVDLGETGNVVLGKENLQVGGFGWIAPQDLKHGSRLEDTRDLVAGQKHRNSPLGRLDPVGKLALGVGIRTVHFVQDKAQRLGVIAKQRGNASGVLTGLYKGLHICKTADGLTCIEFQNFELTRTCGGKSKSGLADTRWSVQEQDSGIRGCPKVGPQTVFHLGVSNHLLQDFGTTRFAPHGLSS
jgi:hypothetical protein